ncbi:hypothetical protein TNCV_2206781 [Trichonephila clavipes]|uniref:Uncharacterized protein n=1 Tax=Trichonephila clavipes TaxID=2585209 RepID=A0A8X6S9E4_TRICX|nr:hypothetical protein TNCV_2206781 [Trichonephila clavipes]
MNNFHTVSDVIPETFYGLLGRRSLDGASSPWPLPLTALYIKMHVCLFAVSKISPITTEISSANADFGGTEDYWHTTLLPSTIANIIRQSHHKGSKAYTMIGGCNL